MVSRTGEREFVIVAGATIVIERVTGACATGAPLADVVVAGMVVRAGIAVVLGLALPPGVATLELSWSSMSEKLCD